MFDGANERLFPEEIAFPHPGISKGLSLSNYLGALWRKAENQNQNSLSSMSNRRHQVPTRHSYQRMTATALWNTWYDLLRSMSLSG